MATKLSSKIQHLRNLVFWHAQHQVKGLTSNADDIYDLVFKDGKWKRRSEIGVRGMTSGSLSNKASVLRKQLKAAVEFNGIYIHNKSLTKELTKLSDVDKLTVDHKSGSYCHVKRIETKKHRGVRFMWGSDHKSFTMEKLKIYKHKK